MNLGKTDSIINHHKIYYLKVRYELLRISKTMDSQDISLSSYVDNVFDPSVTWKWLKRYTVLIKFINAYYFMVIVQFNR